MKTIRYAVLAIGPEWRVVSGQRRIGHFASRGQAFETALRFAQEASRSGHRAELLYADQGGELHTIRLPLLSEPTADSPTADSPTADSPSADSHEPADRPGAGEGFRASA